MIEENYRVAICMKCLKSIYVSDKGFYAIPVKIKGKFSHNEFYHINCYKSKEEEENEMY